MRVGLAVLLVVLLGACGSSSRPVKVSRTASNPVVAAARGLESPDLFAGVDDAKLLTLARRMCADDKAGDLAPGNNTATASGLVTDDGWTWAQAAGLQKVARSKLCPAL